MASKPLPGDQILTLLAEAPPRIAALTAGLTPAQLRTAPSPGEWSANEVLAHLRACGDVWGGSIMRIITEDNPAWRAMNPRTWMKRTNYPELDFTPSFKAYAAQRAELLATLESLAPQGWSRTATITGMIGDVYERTVHFYAEGLARHERPHLKQMERIAGTVRAVPR